MNEAQFVEDVNRFQAKIDKLSDVLTSLENDFNHRLRIARKEITNLTAQQGKISSILLSYKNTLEREANRKERSLEREIKLLKEEVEQLQKAASTLQVSNSLDVAKATTLAIFDSILFAISNWSKTGDIAPDFEVVSQASLFPLVYERVMKGDEGAYLLSSVPHSAYEVVRRGREYVRHFRESCDYSLLEPVVWHEKSKLIHEWWVHDALPLLYGERDEQWEVDIPFTLEEMLNWRDNPANRPISFPTLFDGMELVEKYRDEIRDKSGLPDFNKTTIQTKLEALS